MAFSSLLFLCAFFPAFVLAYWATPRIGRNAVLLLLSVVFYAWGAPWFLPIILGLGILDFYLARAIAARRGTRAARWLLGFAVAMHLSVLAYFKYANFFVGELGALLTQLSDNRAPIGWTHVALPIGISFITFEEISYVVDVYRGDAKPSRSVPQYLLFLMLFPHSIAGPIFRWKDLESQLRERNERLDDIVVGITRFVWGLAKKILVADAAAVTADAIFALSPGDVTVGLAWLGALAYTVQIYYDFSGYSDMAIGLGRIAGFRFKENFNDPYVSTSITEFWARWHMSLSSWLRDYLYIPLGGNRRGEARARVNVLIVFALSGLWHGAAWTFVLWGVYHGLLTLLERTTLGRLWRERAPRWVAMPVTFVLVVIGWVFFRATSGAQALGFIQTMFFLGGEVPIAKLSWAEVMPNRSLSFIVFGLALVVWRALVGRPKENAPTRWFYVAFAPALLILALSQVANTKFVPLIYFKF